MKPTVITNNSGSGGGANTPQTAAGHPHIDPTNEGSGSGSRQFPHFQEFGFDPDIDNMFSDTGIRSRLGRMPFNFGSRKRFNDPNRYFDDDNDFFSHFGSLGRRRHPQTDRAGIFEHIPSEFRQYMPDAFEFPQTVRNTPPSPRSAGTQPQYPPQYPPQYYETYGPPGPGSPTTLQPQAQKPKLCDAAIQTEFPPDDETDHSNKAHKTQPLKQHGMRNTVDLGQKSPPENENIPRAQSAPPNDPSEQAFANASASASAYATNPDNVHTSSTAYAYVPPPEQQRWQPQQSSPPQSHQRPNIPHPPPRSQSHQQQYYQPQQSQPQQQSSSQNQGGSYVRTVPIFVEGRSEPVINEQKHAQFESQPPSQHKQQQSPPQYRSHKEFRPQQPQQQPQQQQPQQPAQQQHQPYQQHYPQQQQQQPPQQQQSQGRPTPLNTQQANTSPSQQSPVPSTPQTTATIEKIQLIQRDVLDLMTKVEKFTGVKSDKEYMYLDEMLTRNLLKLDTIDTQGKERIRLARKEAIKCIQASINVLEAKAAENSKAAQESVMNASQEMSTNTESKQNETATENAKSDSTPIVLDEASTAKLPDVVPLPPPPERPSKEKPNPQTNEIETVTEQQNQKIKEQTIESGKGVEAIKLEENPEIKRKQDETIQKDESTKIEQTKDESVTPSNNIENSKDSTPIPTEDEQNKKDENKQKDEKQKSPTKDERAKESPKKKIVKKIIKKLEKKDKKGSATPPTTEQEASSDSPPMAEVTN